mgnify:CR=1 FL=1|jgi:hypothetical protein
MKNTSYRITDGHGVLIAEIDDYLLTLVFKKIRSKKRRHRKKLLKKILVKGIKELCKEE